MATRNINDDAKAVARCIKGDLEAFSELIRRHRALAVAVAFSICRDRALAEDIAQDAFIKAHGRMKQIRRRESFGAWLARLVKNMALRVVADESRLEKVHKLMAEQVRSRVENPTASLEVAELLARVDADARNMLMMRYVQGMKCADIAAQLRVPIGTVTSKICRALATIRDGVAEERRRLR